MALPLLVSMVLASATLSIEVDTQLLNEFLARNYASGIELVPTVSLKDITITSIAPDGMSGRANIEFRGTLPMGSWLPFMPRTVSWDLSVPMRFRCRPKMRGTMVVIPVSGLSFSLYRSPMISLAVFEAFQRWWRRFVSSRTFLEIRAFDVSPHLRRYFAPGRWDLTLELGSGVVRLRGTRRK